MGVVTSSDEGFNFLGGDRQINELMKEGIQVLFSEDSKNIVQSTELEKSDIFWSSGLEILYHLVIEPYCYDRYKVEHIRNVIDRLYQIRVSLKREGRKEIFNAMKQEQQFNTMLEMQKPATLK